MRFTLCAPDGAFPARLAHPSLGIIDAVTVDAVADDPDAARSVAGAGGFRVTAWADDGNLRLARIDGRRRPAASATPPPAVGPCGPVRVAAPASAAGSAAPASPPPPVIVLRWAASPAERSAALREAAVDGIDAPAPADAADMATLPELVVLPRPGLETAYLGFGTGKSLSQTGVRRAFAQALDQAAIARDAFPPGSAPATHTTPCEVPAGCAGTPWYEFNGPAASAALDAAKFDRKVPITLHVPDAPLPGLPDPAATAAAVRDQLAASVGVTVEIDVMPAAELAAGVAEGTLDGLYLGGVRSSLADPSGFLEPLFGEAATGTAADRAKGVREALADAAQATAAATREAAFAAANDAVRSTAAIVPLAHAGSTVAYRADVAGVAMSPLGVDPVGTFVPGDRRQLVVMGEGEPAGAWCAVDPSPGGAPPVRPRDARPVRVRRGDPRGPPGPREPVHALARRPDLDLPPAGGPRVQRRRPGRRRRRGRVDPGAGGRRAARCGRRSRPRRSRPGTSCSAARCRRRRADGSVRRPGRPT